jgi:hypothetical protein
MSSDQVERFALKPASVGIVSGAAAAAWRFNTKVLIGGKSYPFPLIIAGASAAASLVCELINSEVFSHIPQIGILSHPIHTGLNIGVQTGVVCGLENALSPGLISDQGLTEIVGFAAIGEIGGNYLYTEWLKPWYRQMLGADSY